MAEVTAPETTQPTLQKSMQEIGTQTTKLLQDAGSDGITFSKMGTLIKALLGYIELTPKAISTRDTSTPHGPSKNALIKLVISTEPDQEPEYI